VLVEAGILDGDHRLLHHLGDLVARNRGAVLLVEARDHLAVGGEHHGVAGRRLAGQLDRRIAEQAARLLRGDRGSPDPRQQQSGEQGTGEHQGEGERAQRADAFRTRLQWPSLRCGPHLNRDSLGPQPPSPHVGGP
jgi:hypothetical protein